MTSRFQWIAAAAFGCVGLGDGPGDDARGAGPDAADLMRVELRSTLPRADETGLLQLTLPAPWSLPQSRSPCRTGQDEDGG
jgi:hypothetical protein